MQEAAHENKYALLLGNTLGDDEMEAAYAKMVQTSQADGLIQLRAHNPFSAAEPAEPNDEAPALLPIGQCL